MVYSGVVGRTQVYLTDLELQLLDHARRTTGASRSELIRRAVRSTFGRSPAAARVAALERGKGIWRDRPTTGPGDVDPDPRGLDERPARSALE